MAQGRAQLNTYLWEESQNFINEVAKRAVMLVEALGMNTAQPSDLANTMPAYLLQRLHHPDADLNPSVTISTAQQCYPRERKRIVSDSCDLGEEISLLSNPYAGRIRKMSMRIEVENSSPRMDKAPVDLISSTKDERSSQKLELTKATCNAPVGDDNPMLSKLQKSLRTRTSSNWQEKRNEKEPDERIKWKNMCLKEETHVEAEKRFGEVEKARLEQKKLQSPRRRKRRNVKLNCDGGGHKDMIDYELEI
ncbi:hypothetical protein BT96DRAFT_951394 [Gymnopus androsaceus JB14]|uniref:Uncharacterized protein n=1 Tax=Gymnopus androsaceus JB14 TaxID=1447944 RepID=A0A6A4GD01_9AGAR|nr:hypothetical protein BT96DRAFT_951394 [Gymnopus androsaceus JB14]